MAAQFGGTVNVDIRDPVPVPVAVDVSGGPYLNLEREADAALIRE